MCAAMRCSTRWPIVVQCGGQQPCAMRNSQVRCPGATGSGQVQCSYLVTDLLQTASHQPSCADATLLLYDLVMSDVLADRHNTMDQQTLSTSGSDVLVTWHTGGCDALVDALCWWNQCANRCTVPVDSTFWQMWCATMHIAITCNIIIWGAITSSIIARNAAAAQSTAAQHQSMQHCHAHCHHVQHCHTEHHYRAPLKVVLHRMSLHAAVLFENHRAQSCHTKHCCTEHHHMECRCMQYNLLKCHCAQCQHMQQCCIHCCHASNGICQHAVWQQCM